MRIFFQPVDDVCNAIFDERHLEVDEQAQTLVGEPQVGQKLLLVNRSENLDGFHFHDHLIFDDQVGAEAGVNAHTVVDHRNRLLPHRAQTPAAQFICQDWIVDRFEQARPERRMDAEGGIHNLLGDGVLGHSGFL